jgi:hypothetical protein|tara:strand:- start:220 stop:825 length:606 start_codon:yes stop_codon:yes gene_type:complete
MTGTSMYTTRDAFELYTYYMAMKKHFTTSYDYVKYGGKMRLSVDSFENRKDKFFFYKLAKRRDCKDFVLANLIQKPNLWIGDLVNSEYANTIYTEWSKRQQAITYVFKNELEELDDDFNSNFVVEDGQYPNALKLYNTKRVSIESLIILDDLTHCFKYWDRAINDTIVYPSINKIVQNYKPFLSYDKAKMRKICLDKYSVL